MVGSYLQKQGYSLKKANIEKVAAFKNKRDAMVGALADHFSSPGKGKNTVKWSKPAGGFFLSLEVPFEITDALLKECVEEYDVIFCPMSYFYLEEKLGARQMRLAFSNLSLETIKEGIDRLADFIKGKF